MQDIESCENEICDYLKENSQKKKLRELFADSIPLVSQDIENPKKGKDANPFADLGALANSYFPYVPMEENKCFRFLKMASLGKYHTKLYYGNKKGEYSTVTGGVITLSVVLVLIVTSINILIQTFKRDSYTVSSQYT